MKMLIGGKWIDKDEKIEVLDPENEKVIDYVPRGSVEDVKKAYELLERGKKVMASLSTFERYKILRNAAELVERRFNDFVDSITSEGVKTLREARKEVQRAINTLTYAAEEAKRIGGEWINFDADFRKDRRQGFWLREPVGIVLAITPYNDPLNMVCHKVGPAIAAGNAVLLKPAVDTPLTALKLGEVLLEAGLPELGLSIITGYSREIGDALVSDPRPRVISFTGGTEAGEEITRKAGIKKLMMELGSSSCVIVCEDVPHFEKAVDICVEGSFWAAGQNCIGVQRIFVEHKIYDKFLTSFVERTQRMKIGPKKDETTDMGPMINKKEADRVMDWIEEAINLGGKLLTGGRRNGNYIEPTVLTKVPREAKVVCKEVFGPVVVIEEFQTLDEAIEKANETEYGLHAAIFTKDIDKAWKAIRGLEFGSVFVNDSTDFRVDYMPFGGFKNSGIFREGLKFAIDIMTEIKVVGFNVNW